MSAWMRGTGADGYMRKKRHGRFRRGAGMAHGVALTAVTES